MTEYNFTERVKHMLDMSREEAARLQHEYIGTEHILLGLIRDEGGVGLLREEKGVGAQMLVEAGLRTAVVRAEMLRILGPA